MFGDINCYMCGATWGDFHTEYGSRPVVLVHIDKSVICTLCNEGASNITPDQPSLIKMKAQIRKATNQDQRALLDWLNEKFDTAR